MMRKTDEEAACIEWHPERRALLLKDWRYFSEPLKFTDFTHGQVNYQGVFDIWLPNYIVLIPQPQIKGFHEPQLEQQSIF